MQKIQIINAVKKREDTDTYYQIPKKVWNTNDYDKCRNGCGGTSANP
jgi:hypothetical protein